MAVEALEVRRLTPEHAARALHGVAKRDPRGITTQSDLERFAERGECFAISAPGGAQIAYLLSVENGQCWVQACQASGGFDFSDVLLPVLMEQARGVCHSVAFQTARPGLVRKATRRGFRVVGWILKKDME